MVDIQKIKEATEKNFTDSMIPSIMDYVRIPNLSKAFDPEWESNGLLQKAAEHIRDWIVAQNVKGLSIEIIKDKGAAPLIYAEIERTDNGNGNILMYGHYDKQPHFTGWKEGLSPIEPVQIGDRIYGRGISDDGYAAYSSILAIKQCQELGYPHPRCILTIEGEEESGSPHYLNYIAKLKDRIKEVNLIICLDSGAVNYDTMWLTQSLRGAILVQTKVTVLNQGQHSGYASGVVPTPFRIATQLISRIENQETGTVIDKLQVQIPENRQKEIANLASSVKDSYFEAFPFHGSTQPVTKDVVEAIKNRTWRAQLTLTGLDGISSVEKGGNVIGESVEFKLSIRTPPTLDTNTVRDDLINLIESNPPYNAKVEVNRDTLVCMNGFNANDLNPQFQAALEQSSINFFGQDLQAQGEGGSIPLMVELQKMYPQTQFIVTGVLGPESNAHGPNEMLDVPYCKNLTGAMTQMVADFSRIYQ